MKTLPACSLAAPALLTNANGAEPSRHQFRGRDPFGPRFESFAGPFAFNCDPSPTMQFLLDHRKDAEVKPFFALAFGTRAAEELYDLKNDPAELRNVATEPQYAPKLAKLRGLREAELRKAQAPAARK